ncbi:MAG: hypothetical protein U9O66_00825 [Patescibacteria group bacterium]|nr:hypothetical protein [Patescibacteria group bacterium]
MLEFPKIENLSEQSVVKKKPEEKDLLKNEEDEEKKEKKEELPHAIKANFEINSNGLVDIKTEYGILKDIPKDCLQDDFKNQESGEIKIILTDHNVIAKKMLNELLKTSSEDE